MAKRTVWIAAKRTLLCVIETPSRFLLRMDARSFRQRFAVIVMRFCGSEEEGQRVDARPFFLKNKRMIP
jgi:hypothetical protein